MQDEILDLVNDKDEVIGSISKTEAHKNNKLHREIAVIIFNHNNETLLQQRSAKKSNDPLKWVCACAGHVFAGEDPKEAALRELHEELGFKCELEFFGKLFMEDKKHGESKFYWIYYGFYDESKFVLQEEEVEAVKWFKLSELTNVYENEFKYGVKDQTYITTMEIAKKIGLVE